jgi:predicted phage-related endonuclease
MKKTTTNINEAIRQIKEYQDLQEQVKAEIEALKAECIEYLDEHATDEYLCDEGKITYREVLSNRFQSTEFKKIHGDLYKAFTKQTASMRFTCN